MIAHWQMHCRSDSEMTPPRTARTESEIGSVHETYTRAVQGKLKAGQQQAAVARIQQQRDRARQQGAVKRLGGNDLSQAARSAIASTQAAG